MFIRMGSSKLMVCTGLVLSLYNSTVNLQSFEGFCQSERYIHTYVHRGKTPDKEDQSNGRRGMAFCLCLPLGIDERAVSEKATLIVNMCFLKSHSTRKGL